MIPEDKAKATEEYLELYEQTLEAERKVDRIFAAIKAVGSLTGSWKDAVRRESPGQPIISNVDAAYWPTTPQELYDALRDWKEKLGVAKARWKLVEHRSGLRDPDTLLTGD